VAGRTLGRELVDALKEGVVGEVSVEQGALRARATVRGSGRYGAELDGLTVERAEAPGDTDRTDEVTHGIAERVDYLPEPLELLELGPERGQLRTRRDRVQGGEYFEVDVAGGRRVDVGRVRFAHETKQRHRQSYSTGHGVLRRLVDDLAELIDGGADPAQH